MSSIIEVKQLMKRYKGATDNALNGLSLAINQGDVFGLLGPNGSGKTTLISILCGILKAGSGDYTKLSQSQIGLVPQEIALYPTLSLQQNLHYFASLYQVNNSQQRIDQCINTVGLTKVKDKPVQTYSGGMKRRANLAAGILHEPAVLFLDEPTVNVDPQSREAIFTCLRKLNQQGMTLVYATHYLEEAENLCNEIAIIDHGCLVAQASPQKLLQQHVDCRNLGDIFLKLTGKELRD
jgi:ABC-2 type transport system ATP-binding protein